MSDSTTRTLTFVFTDIEGSTRLLRALGSDYQRVLREHDRIVASATAANGGEAFGSEGDAQHLVFEDARSAVAAATQAQRDLASHEWPAGHVVRVRMGVHTGEAQRDASGFVGLTLHEAARISSAGHGGQVLLSLGTAELVRSRLPARVELRDLGRFGLKDIEEPLQLFDLRIEGLDHEFPPLRARAAATARLPRPVTSFVERDEVDAIVGAAASSRLLTLTGPGGTGKTRLAIEVAERIAERFSDGTWFVALDTVLEAPAVVPEIATTLGLGTGTEPPLDQLIGYLRERSVLLVLDNLEQAIEAGPAVAEVVRECPGVSVITTSRIPMRVYGEQEYPVPALPLPAPETPMTATDLRSVASVRLFEDRARAAKPSFEISDANATDVADIVARLDGLPLAIELAAARIRMLPVPALRARLDDRLGTLDSGTRDRPSRQQTLRGAIGWSHDLLDEPDAHLFARFGVMAGSAALSQVEAIAGPGSEIGRDVFDGLESLSQQSLVQVIDSDEDEPRFAMLATIRAYALERLAESGEAELIARRHAEAYLALAEEAAPGLLGPAGVSLNDRLERDHDDLRVTLDWIVANDEAELGLRMIVALWRFWQVRGHLHQGGERVQAVLAMPSVASQPAALRSRAELAAGGVAYWRSLSSVTRQHYDTALLLARESQDKALLAEALYNAGFAPYADNDAQGHEMMLASASHFEEALALYTELGDEAGIARTSWSLAIQAAVQGDIDTSRRLARSSLDAARSIGDEYQAGWSLHTLGQSDVMVGELEDAARHIRESLDIWVRAGDMSGVTLLLIDAVLVARARDQEACSWQLLGAEERLRQETGTDLGRAPIEFVEIDPRRMPENDDERSWFDQGRSLSTQEAIELARNVALAD